MPRPGLGRVPAPEEVARAASLYPVTRRVDYRTATNTYKYWWQGGAWLDQGQTGTCVGHAFAHRRADSPVPKGGIDSAYAMKLYLDASGDSTYQVGTNAVYACRVLKERGTISDYSWVTSAEELRNTVLAVGSVCVGTAWFESMFDPYSKYSAKYLRVDPSSGIAGGHEYLINGLNLQPTYGRPYYRLKNSWGTSWGSKGTARIYCADLEDLLFNRNGDAVIVAEAL